jgi:hypothetical protein
MTLPIIIYAVVWALCVLPIAHWAARNLTNEHDEPIEPGEAGAIGLIWAGLWPAILIGALIVGVSNVVGLIAGARK